MAQPLPYERDYDFQNFQSGHPSTPLPGDKVNAELDQVAATLDEVLARIALLQDDDTALKRKSVGYDQFADNVALGFEPPSAWLTATAYIVRDTVFQGNAFYQCLVSHTSGTFSADLAAGKWELLADFTSATEDAEAAQAAAEAAQALAEAARDSATASASSASSNAASASASANSASADAEQTAADRIATAADRVATAADRVQTGLDATSSSASAAAASASAASITIGPGGVQAYVGDDVARMAVEDQTLTGGARVTSKSLGTITSGTVTPDPGDRPLQHYTNNGAHALEPGSNTGSYLLDIVNGALAGAITTSAWTKVEGSFTTTEGHKFRCSCSVGNAGSLLSVMAMQ